MGIIKDNNYSIEELEITRLFGAISHPARKRILDLLQQHFILRNVDLCTILNLSPTAVMNHLNRLREVGLIDFYYSIHYHEIILYRDRLRKIMDYLEKFEVN